MRRKIIELEVIEFVIKIVLRRIFDFHLKFYLKQITLSHFRVPPCFSCRLRVRLGVERCLLKALKHSKQIC